MSRTTALRRSFLINLLVMVSAVVLLQACGSDKKAPPPVVDAVPNGYYGTNGTAAVFDDNNTTPLPINDLQGMVYNGRIIMLSYAEDLSYDGTIAVNGNGYSGSVTIYRLGTPLTTATVSGTISQGSTITGTLTGTGAGRGTFTLNYSPKNSEAAALSIVARPWTGPIFSTGSYVFTVADVTGVMTTNTPVANGPFQGCVFLNDATASSTMAPIGGQHLYAVAVTLSGCATNTVNGAYTGFASTRNTLAGIDDRLPLVVSNGTNSLHTEF